MIEVTISRRRAARRRSTRMTACGETLTDSARGRRIGPSTVGILSGTWTTRHEARSLTDDPRPAKAAQAPNHQTPLAGGPPPGERGDVRLRGAPAGPPRPAAHLPAERGGGHGADLPGPR